MSDRTPRRSSARTSEVVTRTIDPVEEKVVRMRHGYAAPDDLKLEQVGQSNPDIRAKLREIELRALEKSGRLDELRREVGLEVEGADPAVKQKIVSRLRQTASASGAPAKKKSTKR